MCNNISIEKKYIYELFTNISINARQPHSFALSYAPNRSFDNKSSELGTLFRGLTFKYSLKIRKPED